MILNELASEINLELEHPQFGSSDDICGSTALTHC